MNTAVATVQFCLCLDIWDKEKTLGFYDSTAEGVKDTLQGVCSPEYIRWAILSSLWWKTGTGFHGRLNESINESINQRIDERANVSLEFQPTGFMFHVFMSMPFWRGCSLVQLSGSLSLPIGRFISPIKKAFGPHPNLDLPSSRYSPISWEKNRYLSLPAIKWYNGRLVPPSGLREVQHVLRESRQLF